MLPFRQAKKLPFYFYGSIKFSSLKGSVKISAPIKRGMIGFGQQYEMNTRSKGIAELYLRGRMEFNGFAQFGKDNFIYIKEEAKCVFGNMASIGTSGKLICTNSIVLGNYARFGSECQIIDTNFHKLIDVETKEAFRLSSPIEIGNYNFVSTRVTVLSKTKTPDYCTIASNSLCNKDYIELGNNILIGGVPAKLLKTDITRDWEGEKDRMDKHLIV
ncbi:acyltransferase [Psychroserpens luteolus]|uniref:acyltransferase n=1 Tax=Psychroserpens luteolus TaxID=2855840 RepID=UPI001E2AF1DE|nr:transferase [Psychroserpens luteolus]MCD2260096.1 transferase [Psychroserpens luteolus]